MTAKKASLAFGVVFLLIGVLGFFPVFTPNGMLLGIFMVGAVHNIIHLLSGVAALAASSSEGYATTYFKVFGVVYALVTVIGFAQGNSVLGLIDVNLADNLLHLVIAAVSLYIGFGRKHAVAV